MAPFAVALWLLAGGGVAAAQPAQTAEDGLGLIPGRPTVRPPRTDTPPDIDGRLDDAAWRSAATITEFTQQAPLEGAPATEDTEVYLAYDSEHLYLGFHLHYSDPGLMRANRVDRDTAWQDDLITIYIDTFLDQQRAYDFDLNAFNVQGDGIVNATGNTRGGPIPIADRSWDVLFHSATRIVDDGYMAEMAIPFKSLRYPQRAPGQPHQWGFQIVREIKGKNEENAVWAPMSRDVAGFHRQMGLMEGMTDFSTSRNLELLPSFSAIQFGSLDPDKSRYVDLDVDPDVGLNIKYGLTSNLTVRRDVQPRLLADRIRSAADRGEPARPAVFQRTASLLRRRRRDLRLSGSRDVRAHPDHCRSDLGRQADRQGGAVRRRDAHRRGRSARQCGRPAGRAIRPDRAEFHRPREVRRVFRIARRRHLHRPRVSRFQQQALRCRWQLPPVTVDVDQLPIHRIGASRPGRSGTGGSRLRRQHPDHRAQSRLVRGGVRDHARLRHRGRVRAPL